MPWFVQLTIYLISLLVSFFVLAQVEWAKIIRVSRRELAWLVYVVFSIALAGLIGYQIKTLVEIFCFLLEVELFSTKNS
ncbi:hypothetical protein [Mycoplasma sp. ATU-Cv-508]|uniref:hypothetical protein n=1 Tax=Mycoplasma sp. ATU-Cv-508 TaxID=2048001 RepID=UPI000FDD10FD